MTAPDQQPDEAPEPTSILPGLDVEDTTAIEDVPASPGDQPDNQPDDQGGDQPGDQGGDQPDDQGGDQPGDQGGDQPEGPSGDPSVDAPQTPPGRPVRVAHLVFGVAFCGLAGLWLLVHQDVVGAQGLGVVAPGLLVVAGLAGLAAAWHNARAAVRAARP